MKTDRNRRKNPLPVSVSIFWHRTGIGIVGNGYGIGIYWLYGNEQVRMETQRKRAEMGHLSRNHDYLLSILHSIISLQQHQRKYKIIILIHQSCSCASASVLCSNACTAALTCACMSC